MRNKPTLILSVLFCIGILPTTSAHSAKSLKIAVLEFQDFTNGSLKPEQLGYFSDLIRKEAQSYLSDRYFILTREGVIDLLKRHAKELSDCTDACEIEIGRMIGANYIFSGELIPFGRKTKVTLKLHEIQSENGRFLGASIGEAETLSGLEKAIMDAAQELLSIIESPPDERDEEKWSNRLKPKWFSLDANIFGFSYDQATSGDLSSFLLHESWSSGLLEMQIHGGVGKSEDNYLLLLGGNLGANVFSWPRADRNSFSIFNITLGGIYRYHFVEEVDNFGFLGFYVSNTIFLTDSFALRADLIYPKIEDEFQPPILGIWIGWGDR